VTWNFAKIQAMQNVLNRVRVASASWCQLKSGRQRTAMLLWVAGLTEAAASLMRWPSRHRNDDRNDD
jgi:hypothetical protein